MDMDGILNLTQHPATSDQIEDGVVEPSAEDKKVIQTILTFEEIPSAVEIHGRATDLALIAERYKVAYAMIGGAPFLMSDLERTLVQLGIGPLYAFSKRTCIETPQAGGSVSKQQVFKHIGFVRVMT